MTVALVGTIPSPPHGLSLVTPSFASHLEDGAQEGEYLANLNTDAR